MSQALTVRAEHDLLELLELLEPLDWVFVVEDAVFVGSSSSKVGSPALSKVIAGMFEENPGGGLTPGGGGLIMPGPEIILASS